MISNKDKIIKFVLATFLFLLSLSVISVAYPNALNAATDSSGKNTSSVDSSGKSTASGIHNPLGENTGSLSAFVAKILHLVFEIGAILVVFFIILSGFKFVLAQGEPAALTKAKDMLLYTIIGAVILLGAETISIVISNTVKQLAQ